MTKREFELVEFFLANPGRVSTRVQVVAALWPTKASSTGRIVDVYVGRLRQKLGHQTIQTVTKVGYRLAIRLSNGQEVASIGAAG